MKRFLLILFLISNYSLFGQLEIPEINSEKVVIHRDFYSFQYNEKYELSDWVAYELLKDEIINNIERTDNFRVDPLVKTGTATKKDYYKSGYDRGHLAPAADMKYNSRSMSESFYFSNMAPQTKELNRYIWKDLESIVRSWAYKYNTVYVVTGPIVLEGHKTIGDNEVAVPQYFYKAILLKKNNNWQTIAFILPNISSGLSKDIKSYITTVDKLEEVLRYDLFPLLDDSIENKIEANYNTELFEFKKYNKQPTKTVDVERTNTTQGKYWINSSSNTRHNSSCRYYENTKKGYLTDKKEGKACGQCGG